MSSCAGTYLKKGKHQLARLLASSTWILVLVLLNVPSSLRAQTTIDVPAAAPTIQAAINGAQSGDTIIVAPGTYSENINFQGKAITVTSSSGSAVTILDGGGGGAAASFTTGEPRTAILNGFTIQNGAPGLFIQEADPTITNNIIINSRECGIYSEEAAPLIQNNVISNTRQGRDGCFSSAGTGLMIVGQPHCEQSQCPITPPGGLDAQVIGNTFENNEAMQGGGGISLWDVDQPLIQNNIFRFNQSVEGGGAIQWVNDGAPIIVQNLMYGNQAFFQDELAGADITGGALSLAPPDGQFEYIGGKVINNVIFGNTSGNTTLPNQPGSQVYVTGFWDHLRIANNIIVTAAPNSAVLCNDLYEPNTTPLIDHNDVLNTAGPAYSGSCTVLTGTNGNISADPKFKNATTDDFHTLAGSPAIDAGNNDAPDLPPLDFGGNPRIQDATNLGHAVIDMGAYEYPGKTDLLPSATALSAAPNPANLGQQVIFTAIVTAAQGTPAGMVTFADGAVTLGTQTLNNGTAVYSTTSLGAGSHTITATYGQSISYSSSSASLIEVINGLPSEIALTAAPANPYALQPVTLRATVAVQTGTATGTITFYDAGAVIGTAMLSAGAGASIQYAFPASGMQTLTAKYSGDSTFNQSTSAPNQLNVLINNSTSTVSASPAPGLALQLVTLNAQVTSSSAAAFAVSPYGMVTFYDGAVNLGSAALGSAGASSFLTSTLAAGTHQVYVAYAGNKAFQPSTSAAYTLVVHANPTATELTASPNPALIGQPVTLLASVSTPVSSEGAVTFFDGTTAIGSAVLDAAGKATFTTSTLALGSHSLSARFAGSANLLPSNSMSVVETIVAFSGDFSIQATPDARAFYTGEATQFVVAIAASGGFNQTVALSCSGLPPGSTCAFAPAAVPQANGTSSVTIQTSAPHQLGQLGHEPSQSWRGVGGAAVLAALALLVLPSRLRFKHSYFGTCAIMFLWFLNGCGGAGPVTGGTPPGTYNLTLTGVFTEYSQTLTHSTVVSLRVKSLF